MNPAGRNCILELLKEIEGFSLTEMSQFLSLLTLELTILSAVLAEGLAGQRSVVSQHCSCD